MQVVLRQDVDNLGLRGEVVSVARGYARNYLLPRGLAETATPAIVRELEKRNAQRARHEAQTAEEGNAIAARLEATELRFDVNAGPTGSLFGSVTATNVVDKLWDEMKIRVDRRKLDVGSIKRIGRYTVPVEVFGDVTAELRLLIVPEGGELPPDEEIEAAAEAEAAAAQAEAAATATEPADLSEIEAGDDSLVEDEPEDDPGAAGDEAEASGL